MSCAGCEYGEVINEGTDDEEVCCHIDRDPDRCTVGGNADGWEYDR